MPYGTPTTCEKQSRPDPFPIGYLRGKTALGLPERARPRQRESQVSGPHLQGKGGAAHFMMRYGWGFGWVGLPTATMIDPPVPPPP